MIRQLLIASLMAMPITAWSQDYRAIVETKALSERPMTATAAVQTLHTYQPGDTVKMIRKESCSAAACEVVLPDGQSAWVPSYKISSAPDLAAEQKSYQKIPWDRMSESDVFFWAIYKQKPVFAHACAVTLAGGEPPKKEDIESLCEKVRHSKEVENAVFALDKALKSMDENDQAKLLSGGAPIGAPKGAVFLAWGKPNDTKRTITKDLVTEQIIFDDRVAYIENGVLTMIQE